jgi:hypothetical protein
MNTRPSPPSPGRYSAIAVRPASQDAQRRESSTSSLDSLAQLEAGLIRIVGGRATAALVQRSRQLCSQHGGAGLPLAHTLVQLAATLLAIYMWIVIAIDVGSGTALGGNSPVNVPVPV